MLLESLAGISFASYPGVTLYPACSSYKEVIITALPVISDLKITLEFREGDQTIH